MRAAVLAAPTPVADAPLALVELPDPVPGRGEVLIQVEACGVCRTDLQLCQGEVPAQLPLTPGHQVVGTVVATAVGGRWTVGDRVGVAWIGSTCGVCRFCCSDRENLCDAVEFTGRDRQGGFADLLVAREDFAYRLPPGIDAVALAPLLCGGAIGLRALGVSGIQPGGRLGLFGFGASATCAIQLARHWGCEVYVATRSPAEQDRARQLGAVWAGGYDDVLPERLDAAVTFAPSGDVVIRALRALDKGAAVAINAIHLDRVPELDYADLWWERQLRSVANVTRRDVEQLLALAAEIPIRTEYVRYSLADVNRALADVDAGRVRGAAVIDVAA